VRLNKFVREQPTWTEAEIAARTNSLAHSAVKIWPALSVSQAEIDAANYRETRDLATRRDVGKVEMSAEARKLFEKLRSHIFMLDSDVLELAEPKSVSYHNPAFFLEVLPRRYSLTLLLALDFNGVNDPSGLAQDATQWEFFIHARHEGGGALNVSDERLIESAVPLIRQAHAVTCG
jgi:predicted transport protein